MKKRIASVYSVYSIRGRISGNLCLDGTGRLTTTATTTVDEFGYRVLQEPFLFSYGLTDTGHSAARRAVSL
jgi:hypothetical protein